MADIELVIKIPEEDLEFLKESDGCRYSRAIIEGVINGTPLPKEHGGLDDLTSKQKAIDTIEALYLEGDSAVSHLANAEGDTLIGKYQAITALDDLPTYSAEQTAEFGKQTAEFGKQTQPTCCGNCGECKNQLTCPFKTRLESFNRHNISETTVETEISGAENEQYFKKSDDLISREEIIIKAKEEAKGMEEPFKSNFAIFVEWLVEKLPTYSAEQNTQTKRDSVIGAEEN